MNIKFDVVNSILFLIGFHVTGILLKSETSLMLWGWFLAILWGIFLGTFKGAIDDS